VPILLATWFGVPRGEIGWEFRSAMIDLTDRRLAEAQEASYQKRLSSLASELSLAQERERRRIAVEIHDNLSQNLALIKMKISMLRSRAEPPEVREALGEVTDLLDPVLERTRSLTFELSPPVLYELGLDEALEWLCERMARQHHMVVRFEGPASGGAGSHAPVPHDVAVLLFQAARELLMNVVKHARARRTTVRSSRGEGRATIMVADDGAGFDTAVLAGPGRGRRPAGASPNGDDGGDGTRGPGNGACGPDHDDLRGFGLFSIRTRLDHLGGRIDIRSGPGEGTVVTLTVPLAADPEPAAVALPADRNHYGPRGVVRRTHVSRRHPQANPDETRTPAPPPREQNRTSASLKRSKNP
jgi:signal transduction histidine kinase